MLSLFLSLDVIGSCALFFTLPSDERFSTREHVFIPTCSFVTGNLLNSLMGSGDEEEGEEVNEDNIPIELD